jgi:hypothetical protein
MIDVLDSNFAFANIAYPSYASYYVHEFPQGHAELSLPLLRLRVFWCGEAEPLAIALASTNCSPPPERMAGGFFVSGAWSMQVQDRMAR